VLETPPEATPFAYLILRAVPSLERGECLNIGVVVFCRQRGFLGARVALDRARLRALDSELDLDELADHLDGLVAVAEGAPGAGPIAALPQSERFGWLAAPSSTIVQPSDVHTGLCDAPGSTLETLFARLVQR
jgi:hypothetical protein